MNHLHGRGDTANEILIHEGYRFMTFDEIATKLEELRVERLRIAPITYGNYKVVLAAYQHILNDMLVLCRNMAQNLTPADTPPLEPGVELPDEFKPIPDLPKAGSFE